MEFPLAAAALAATAVAPSIPSAAFAATGAAFAAESRVLRLHELCGQPVLIWCVRL
jgi:hypothetical protein